MRNSSGRCIEQGLSRKGLHATACEVAKLLLLDL